jgi:hypothetical protein
MLARDNELWAVNEEMRYAFRARAKSSAPL